MPTPPLSAEKIQEAIETFEKLGSITAAATALGIPRQTLQSRLSKAPPEKPFVVETELPSPLPSAEDLIARRKEEFARIDAAKQARKLIDVSVRMDGPIGIAHGGDPHLDDPGTNIALLERHVGIINRTEGLFGANVGDMSNNWVGRLGRLYGEQSTSAAEAWVLVEWFIDQMNYLYMVGGNHDAWSGAGDPLKWITRNNTGIFEYNGVRLNLKFPNGRAIRVNARHDFKGHSMWNTAHGVAKAAQGGWRDQILTCGHLHVSGYQVVKDPSSSLLSHCLRVASYKTHDRYADQLGLPDQNFSECVVTVIDPDARDERHMVTVFLNMEEGAEFLDWKRSKYRAGKRAA